MGALPLHTVGCAGDTLKSRERLIKGQGRDRCVVAKLTMPLQYEKIRREDALVASKEGIG